MVVVKYLKTGILWYRLSVLALLVTIADDAKWAHEFVDAARTNAARALDRAGAVASNSEQAYGEAESISRMLRNSPTCHQ